MMPFTVVFPFGYHVYSLEFHHCIKHKFRYSCSFLQVVVPAASSAFSIFTTVLKYIHFFSIPVVFYLVLPFCVMFFNLFVC
jgi:hypothetical protein